MKKWLAVFNINLLNSSIDLPSYGIAIFLLKDINSLVRIQSRTLYDVCSISYMFQGLRTMMWSDLPHIGQHASYDIYKNAQIVSMNNMRDVYYDVVYTCTLDNPRKINI